MIAAAGFLVSRANQAAGRVVAPIVAGAALLAIVVLTAWASIFPSPASGEGQGGGLRAGDLVISATNARYSTTTLTADAGTVTVDFTNNDLFWHTFTVPALGVDLRAPVKGQRRVSFHAASGTYEFFCAIPGHKQIGMRGTLVIR